MADTQLPIRFDVDDRLRLLESVVEYAQEAGKIALRHYRNADLHVEEKADASVVTAADREVEDFLRDRLVPLIPDSAWIGEEETYVMAGRATAAGGWSPANDQPEAPAVSRAEWLWIVDPVDGTAAFTEGLDTFCISIGLFHRGRPWLGVVHAPVLGHVWQAVHGCGLRYDGRPAAAITAHPMRDRLVLYVDARSHLKYRITWPGKTRSLGSTALHYALVARGAGTGALSTAHVWDYAGAAALLRESGAVCRHLDGSGIDWLAWVGGEHIRPPVLAAPPFMWEELAENIEILSGARLDS